MNKKRIILFLSLLVLISLSVLYVFGDDSMTLSWLKTGDPWGVTDWMSNTTITINLTATVSNMTHAGNITNVTFILAASDASTSTNISWFIVDNIGVETVVMGVSSLNNFSYVGNTFADWNCTNTSNTINCYNATASSLDGLSNTSFKVTVNITALNIDTENDLNFTVYTGADKGGGEAFSNASEDTLYLDVQYPRLIEVNISDSNTTYANGSWLDDSGDYMLYSGAWTVEAIIEDSQIEETSLAFAYKCNDSAVSNVTFDEGAGSAYHYYARQNVGDFNSTSNAGSLLSNLTYVTVTMSPTCMENQTWNNLDAEEYNYTEIAFLANDSFNQVIQLNYTGTDNSPRARYTTELLPGIARINVSQTTVTLEDDTGVSKVLDSQTSPSSFDGTSDFLRPGTLTFNIELTGGYKPDNVMILWNDTGAATTTLAPAVLGGTGVVFPSITNLVEAAALNATNTDNGTWLAGLEDQAEVNETTEIYNVSQALGGNTSSEYAFWVYANNTEHNYTRISGPHRFTLDGGTPTLTMTPPTDRTINPKDSITYKCTGADGGSGVSKIMWEWKKPDGEWTQKQGYETVSADDSDTIIFTGDDTNTAGTYEVRCRVVDVVGNQGLHTSSSGETFSVHYSTGGAAAAAGPSAAADIDLSTQEEITITEKQGTISTFTLDGTTIHKITIKEINELLGTVTITIESDPIEITLKIGETKEVDVDVDGENDISVTLNGITESVADITTKRLTPLPSEVPTEEVPPTEAPTEGPAEEAPSKAWLWILIIVIIVVIGVGYWFMKKKK